jgi:hypothetical protein
MLRASLSLFGGILIYFGNGVSCVNYEPGFMAATKKGIFQKLVPIVAWLL